MSYRPSIGITTHGRNEKGRFDVNAKYVDAVRRAGGYAVLLPPGETDPAVCFEFLDGFVMTGGPDVEPARYGGKMHPELYGIDPDRDACEIALLKAILEHRKPALCICRGMQVLNVALGGTLVEHVPDEYGTSVCHRGNDQFQMHPVTIEPRSRLAKVLGTSESNAGTRLHRTISKLRKACHEEP